MRDGRAVDRGVASGSTHRARRLDAFVLPDGRCAH
jgi:hypothetical protein